MHEQAATENELALDGLASAVEMSDAVKARAACVALSSCLCRPKQRQTQMLKQMQRRIWWRALEASESVNDEGSEVSACVMASDVHPFLPTLWLVVRSCSLSRALRAQALANRPRRLLATLARFTRSVTQID